MAANQVTPLKFVYGGKVVRVVIVDSEPWFVAQDVYGALNIVHCGPVYNRLDDYEKQVVVLADEKTSRIVISKSGFCSVVYFSGAPNSAEFRRWIWREVIPSPCVQQHIMMDQFINDPDFAIRKLTELKNSRPNHNV